MTELRTVVRNFAIRNPSTLAQLIENPLLAADHISGKAVFMDAVECGRRYVIFPDGSAHPA